jgi:hypothetical protein
MIRHVVMFRWNAEAPEPVRIGFLDGLDELLSADKNVRDHKVGTNVGVLEDNFDLVLVADFDDLDGYLRYEATPEHDAFVRNHASHAVGERSAVQHEW